MRLFQLSVLLAFGAVATMNGLGADTDSAMATAPVAAISTVSYAPAVLPGKGLAQHDFLYAGEGHEERIFIVRGGQVVWSYTHPGRGEISEAVLEPNGHILFAHQFGITEITPDKKVVWNFDAPPGVEIHTAKPIGTNSVMFIENANPAKLIVINKSNGAIEHQFEMPVKFPDSVHRQFRRAQVTAAGTVLVAHLDLGKIVEYDWDGKALWSQDLTNCWSAVELPNGNILAATSGNQFVREINRKGETVWEWTAADAPGYKFSNTQVATRLSNGNTLINNWFSQPVDKMAPGDAPVQAIEVTPDKKIVWALRSWTPPDDFGPSTTIQILDDVYAPAILPGKGLAQHDFFYAGEAKDEKMSIVRGGLIVWSYTHDGRGEISDAVLQPNGNILFAHQFGVTEVNPDKKVVWNYDAPPKTEIHTAQPLGTDRVWFIQNGNPAKFVIVNKSTGNIERQFELPVKNTNSVHGQFRHARMTDAGTLLVEHMDLGKVAEYDLSGKELWSADVPGIWSATLLTNGNILAVSSKKFVREINRKGETIWEWTAADAPEYKFSNMQKATRLPNGNTLINNWFNQWSDKLYPSNAPIQAIEVTPDRKVVWALRSWAPPADLGPSTTIQILDDVYAPAVLPGKGLAQHPFLYTGEWDYRNTNQTIFVVRDGKVAWTYDIPIKDADGTLQELGDATMLSNGNIVFCRKVGASEITPDKKIIWDIVAPKGTEIHSIQPVGLDRVLVTQNGNPGKLMLINTGTGKTEKEFTFPVLNPGANPHIQFRRVHETKEGTFLAAHLRDNKVVEYDADFKEIWSYAMKQPWSAARLKNGNTLITANPHSVLEVNKQGEIVWQFSQNDAPEYKFFVFQEAGRLANGDTVICNWCPYNLKDPKTWPGSVQVLEVTPEKKVVWALSEWKDPDLGPASSIQLLDEPGTAENGDLQR